MKNQPMRDIQLGLVLNNQTVAQKYTNPKSASKYEFIIKIKAYLQRFNVAIKKLIEKNLFKNLSQNHLLS